MFEYFAVKQFSQGITGFFVDSLFNFQGSERSARFRASLFIVSHPLCFVKYFFRFFSKSFSFLTAPRLRQPYYCITSSSLCQELFSSFFKIFFVPASLRPPSRASSFPSFGRLSALFRRRLSATALLFYHYPAAKSSPFFLIFYVC